MKRQRHHRQGSQRGSALIEIAVSYGTLVMIAVISLKASINVSSSQTWTVKQAMTDAYMTREVALASRVPFDQITVSGSLWPLSPETASSTVEIGKLPGGDSVTAQLHRTRIPDPNNFPSAGGSGDESSNPAATEAWKLQSLLVYDVGDKEYVKTRTTLRIR